MGQTCSAVYMLVWTDSNRQQQQHTHTYIYIYIYIQTYRHLNTHTQTHTHTHTHTYIYIYIYNAIFILINKACPITVIHQIYVRQGNVDTKLIVLDDSHFPSIVSRPRVSHVVGILLYNDVLTMIGRVI